MADKRLSKAAFESEHSSQETQLFQSQEEDELYKVEAIVNEKGNRYQVKWAGKDPSTGKPWDLWWIPKSDVTRDLAAAWKMQKQEEKERKERRKSKRKSSVAAKAFRGPSAETISSKPQSSSSIASRIRNNLKRKSPVKVEEDDGDVQEQSASISRPVKKRRLSPKEQDTHDKRIESSSPAPNPTSQERDEDDGRDQYQSAASTSTTRKEKSKPTRTQSTPHVLTPIATHTKSAKKTARAPQRPTSPDSESALPEPPSPQRSPSPIPTSDYAGASPQSPSPIRSPNLANTPAEARTRQRRTSSASDSVLPQSPSPQRLSVPGSTDDDGEDESLQPPSPMRPPPAAKTRTPTKRVLFTTTSSVSAKQRKRLDDFNTSVQKQVAKGKRKAGDWQSSPGKAAMKTVHLRANVTEKPAKIKQLKALSLPKVRLSPAAKARLKEFDAFLVSHYEVAAAKSASNSRASAEADQPDDGARASSPDIASPTTPPPQRSRRSPSALPGEDPIAPPRTRASSSDQRSSKTPTMDLLSGIDQRQAQENSLTKRKNSLVSRMKPRSPSKASLGTNGNAEAGPSTLKTIPSGKTAKRLGPIPYVSPSTFTAYLPPTSSVPETDIVDDDDSFARTSHLEQLDDEEEFDEVDTFSSSLKRDHSSIQNSTQDPLTVKGKGRSRYLGENEVEAEHELIRRGTELAEQAAARRRGENGQPDQKEKTTLAAIRALQAEADTRKAQEAVHELRQEDEEDTQEANNLFPLHPDVPELDIGPETVAPAILDDVTVLGNSTAEVLVLDSQERSKDHAEEVIPDSQQMDEQSDSIEVHPPHTQQDAFDGDVDGTTHDPVSRRIETVHEPSPNLVLEPQDILSRPETPAQESMEQEVAMAVSSPSRHTSPPPDFPPPAPEPTADSATILAAQAQQDMTKLQSDLASASALVAKLQSDKEALGREVEFFRTQYGAASDFATSTRKENKLLLERVQTAEHKAIEGVKLVRQTVEGDARRWQKQAASLQNTITFLIGKDHATGNDDLRRRAAEEPELRAAIGRMQQQLRENTKEAEQLEELVLEWETRYRAEKAKSSDLLEENKRLRLLAYDNESVYPCKWRTDGLLCEEVFKTIEELNDHLNGTQHSY